MQGARTIAAVAVLMATLSLAGRAAAQDDLTPQGPLAPNEPVEANGVGITGGVLAGAELILLLEAVIDVEPIWPWWVFPAVGAAGGGVGGYFVEKESPGGAIAMLVVGLAAVIPTAVAVSVARAYEPEDDGIAVEEPRPADLMDFERAPDVGSDDEGTVTEVESRPDEIPEGADESPAEPEPPPPDEEPPPPETPPPGGRDAATRHLASGSLLHVDRSAGFGFGVPAPAIRTAPAPGDGASLGPGRDLGLEITFPVLRVDLP